MAVVLTAALLFAVLTLGFRSDLYVYRIARFYGRGMLRIAGIRVRTKGAQALADRQARLISFNHSSQLDIFMIASVFPPGGTALVKREMDFIPFLGLAFRVFGFPTVDRRDLKHARPALAETAAKLEQRQASVFLAPEGTRSKDGELGPFKMGLFHLAVESDAPIVPVVFRGARECQPMGSILCKPGLVEIEVLPSIDTRDFTRENVHEKRDALRKLYLAALGK